MDTDVVDEVMTDLSQLLAGDGARLHLSGIDQATGTVEVELDLAGSDCLDCVLPPDQLREVIESALRRRVTEPLAVVVDDPRVKRALRPGFISNGDTATIRVLDPTATPPDGNPDAGPPAGPLRGKTVGFRVDVLWDSWDATVEEWTRELERAGATVRTWRRTQGVPGAEGERQQRKYESFVQGIDVLIAGLANCGSCTSWSVRDALTGLNAGVPTVCVATEQFQGLARILAADRGRPGMRLLVLPFPYDTLPATVVRQHARAAFDALLGTLDARVP